ncbi:MAG: peptidoglycan DD-metalloendopeptidase family protein, partial [Proteobacteria bacterium]|nr:peptidoglycan DD-metalloendopeptidase family protein [Pseudomonadota bacterium]
MTDRKKFLIILTAVLAGTCLTQAEAQALIWPAYNCTYITSPYGPRGSTGNVHSGTDISCGGTVKIIAAGDGKVVNRTYSSGQCQYSSYYGTCPSCDNHNGNSVRIDHGGGIQTNYLHMKEVYVSVGQEVKCGQEIGVMGTTGCSTGQHLHFMVYDPYPTHRNPMNYVTQGNYTCPVTCVPSDEVCDGQDNDCDGQVDEDGVCEPTYDPKFQSMVYDPQNTDIDGDGRADLCARGYAGIYCSFSSNDDHTNHALVLGLSNEQGWGDVSNYATIKFADI